MKQQNNRRVHRTMAVVLATGIIALFVGVLPASAFGPNNIEAQMAVSTWGEDGSGNDCDWDNDTQCTKPWDVDDSKAASCTSKGSAYSWFACFMNSLGSVSAAALYGSADKALSVDPGMFNNTALKAGWKTMRNLANLVVVIMLIVTIVSQLTGVGISNYGVKKALPRILVVVLVINFSYILCQVAVDLMAISAQAIKSVFEPLTIAARAKISYDPGTVFAQLMGPTANNAVMVALAYFGTKSFLASGESVIMLLMPIIISLVAFIVVFCVTLFVRRALVVLLTVTAPMAVLLAIFPGTKKTFNRWLDLFKGVLLCYPIAAMLIYGCNFGSTIAMAALGVNSITLAGIDLPVNVFTLIVSVAAAIAPLVVLPNMIIKSTGAIGATIQGVANKITGFANKKWGESNAADRLRRGAMDRRNRLIAGVDENGNRRTGFWANRMRSGSAEERMAAESALAASRAKRRGEENILSQLDGDDTELQEQASKEKFEQLQAAGVGADEQSIEDTLENIFSNADPSNIDSLVGQIDGSMKHFSRVDVKHKGEGILMQKLDDLQARGFSADDARRIRQAVAKSRINSSSFNKSKSAVEYMAYKEVAAGRNVDTKFMNGRDIDSSWVARMVNSPEFTAAALSNYAPPSVSAISAFLSDDANEQASYYPADPTNPNAQQERLDETMEAKRRIREAYDQMIQTASFRQNAASGDFSGIVAALGKGKGR